MNSKLQSQHVCHSKTQLKFPFYSPEKKVFKDVRCIVSLEKKNISSPPHQNAFSPNKAPQIPFN